MDPISLLTRKMRSARSKTRRWYEQRYGPVERHPIVLLGNQKSGTTAISNLVAEACGLPIQSDIPALWEPNQRLVAAQQKALSSIVNTHRDQFNAPIVKEPCLTFIYPQYLEHFSPLKEVFIVRHPLENIRSILNRLGLPGDAPSLSAAQLQDMDPTWRTVVDNTWLGIPPTDYISSMAHRWVYACEQVYLPYEKRMILARYEDFVADKVGLIEGIVRDLNVPLVHDISDRVNVQFNRKGNPSVKGRAFFGEKNETSIMDICGPTLKKMGYEN